MLLMYIIKPHPWPHPLISYHRDSLSHQRSSRGLHSLAPPNRAGIFGPWSERPSWRRGLCGGVSYVRCWKGDCVSEWEGRSACGKGFFVVVVYHTQGHNLYSI